MNGDMYTLLICTVGGATEPLLSSLLHWRPDRVLFVPSPQTRSQVDDILSAHARSAPQPLSPGAYHICVLDNAEDLHGCVRTIRSLGPEVDAWLERGSAYQVVADFTGGTTCMSAALALEARRWRCLFSYVGGSRRTKDGIGIVETGAEQIVASTNPWEALGYQAVEEFVVLFDQRAYAAAADLANRTKEAVATGSKQREFAVLVNLAMALDAWDRFDHKTAIGRLAGVLQGANDLKASIGAAAGDRIVRFIERHLPYLQRLAEQHRRPTADHIRDLLANAQRRRDEGRIDDAVARLYRSIEALAQCALAERQRIESTARVPVDRIPEPLRSKPELRPDEDGTVKLALRDAYALLALLGDGLGHKFWDWASPSRSARPWRRAIIRSWRMVFSVSRPASSTSYGPPPSIWPSSRPKTCRPFRSSVPFRTRRALNTLSIAREWQAGVRSSRHDHSVEIHRRPAILTPPPPHPRCPSETEVVMAQVKLNSDAIWVRSIEGDKQLKETIRALSPGDTIDLEVDGVIGTWEKMRDGRDGRPTQGIRPIGRMRETWKSMQARRGQILQVRRAAAGLSELMALRPLLEEWDTPEDDEAYRDLPLQ